jgi:hypothetical protein
VPNSTIGNLTALTAALGDEIPVNRSGADGKITAGDVANLAAAQVVLDRMKDTTATTGTGTVTFDNDPPDGFIDFDGTVGQQVTVGIVSEDGDDWEIVTGTFASSNEAFAANTFNASAIWNDITGLSSVSVNTVVAPDGSTTACALVEDATSGSHNLGSGTDAIATVTAGSTFTFSIYAKPGVRTELRTQIGVIGTDDVFVRFNLSGAGSISGTSTVRGTATLSAESIALDENGFYRCVVKMSMGGSNTDVGCYLNMRQSNSTSYSGSSGSTGVSIWGLLLQEGTTLNEYTASPTSITRDTVHQSSNHGELVTFSAGTKSVFKTIAGANADKTIWHHVNIKDYGATGDGVTDDTQAFVDFTSDYQGEKVVLTVPPGVYVLSDPDTDDTGVDKFFSGLSHIIVDGYGASSSTGMKTFGSSYSQRETGTTHTALVASVSAGATSLTLLTEADNTKFSAGQWVLLTGYDLQGSGYPTNPYYFEYVKITTISATTINLFRPLKHSYQSDWPDFGDASGIDQGGPATLYSIYSDWDMDIEIRGWTFDNDNPATPFITARGRSVRFVDCAFDGGDFPLATVQQRFECIRCDMRSCVVENDKLVEWCVFRNCWMEQCYTQSASIYYMLLENCWVGDNSGEVDSIKGCAKHMVIKGCFAARLMIGPFAYGQCESLHIEDSTIRALTTSQPFGDLDSISAIADGTITMPMSEGPFNWAVPNGLYCFQGNNTFTNVAQNPPQTASYPPSFYIYDIRQVSTNALFDTSLPITSALPVWSGAKTPDYIQPIPCPRITVINSDGCSEMSQLSRHPEKGRPLWTYDQRTILGGSTGSDGNHLNMARGYLEEIRFNVRRAYTGGQSTQYFSYSLAVVDSAYAYSTWAVRLNLKKTGERIIRPGYIYGLQFDDLIPVLEAGTWFTEAGAQFKLSQSIAADSQDELSIVTITVKTNFGEWDAALITKP